MRAARLKELYTAIEDWAQKHHVETTFIEAKYCGIGDNVHVLVVARKGLENWRDHERHDSLFNFLHANINRNGGPFISLLHIMTEDEYEKYGGDEACNQLASLWYQQRLSQSLVSKIS
jgi:hypothetical protein